MKKLFISLVTACMAFGLYAQCDIYMPMKKGTVYEMTTYNSRDKMSGTVTYMVNDVRNDGADADMAGEVKNEKGKTTSTAAYSIHCKDGELSIDLKSMIPAQTLEGYKDMDIKATAEGVLILPKTLTVGQTLPDAESNWEISAKGSTTVMTTLNMSVTNRKVVAMDTIVTPTGTYNAYKITSDVKMVTSTFGLKVPFESISEEYFCPGTGLVKSIAISKSGKMQGYSLLSKIN